jgi:aryl-alcohol dehydrogenase-like predicted oxidoreductase
MSSRLLTKAHAIATSKNLHGFIVSQENMNLLARSAQSTLAPTIGELNMGLIPYFPLASGMLTGKYKRGMTPAPGSRLDKWKQQTASLLTEQNFDKVERLEAFATEHHHSISELAIAWLLAQPYIPSVIAGASKPAQLENNVKAASWKLTAAEVTSVEHLAPA